MEAPVGCPIQGPGVLRPQYRQYADKTVYPLRVGVWGFGVVIFLALLGSTFGFRAAMLPALKKHTVEFAEPSQAQDKADPATVAEIMDLVEQAENGDIFQLNCPCLVQNLPVPRLWTDQIKNGGMPQQWNHSMYTVADDFCQKYAACEPDECPENDAMRTAWKTGLMEGGTYHGHGQNQGASAEEATETIGHIWRHLCQEKLNSLYGSTGARFLSSSISAARLISSRKQMGVVLQRQMLDFCRAEANSEAAKQSSIIMDAKQSVDDVTHITPQFQGSLWDYLYRAKEKLWTPVNNAQDKHDMQMGTLYPWLDLNSLQNGDEHWGIAPNPGADVSDGRCQVPESNCKRYFDDLGLKRRWKEGEGKPESGKWQRRAQPQQKDDDAALDKAIGQAVPLYERKPDGNDYAWIRNVCNGVDPCSCTAVGAAEKCDSLATLLTYLDYAATPCPASCPAARTPPAPTPPAATPAPPTPPAPTPPKEPAPAEQTPSPGTPGPEEERAPAPAVTQEYTFEGEYSKVVGSSKAAFLQECSAALAPAVCTDVRAGSIIVTISAATQEGVSAAVATLSAAGGLDLPSFPPLTPQAPTPAPGPGGDRPEPAPGPGPGPATFRGDADCADDDAQVAALAAQKGLRGLNGCADVRDKYMCDIAGTLVENPYYDRNDRNSLRYYPNANSESRGFMLEVQRLCPVSCRIGCADIGPDFFAVLRWSAAKLSAEKLSHERQRQAMMNEEFYQFFYRHAMPDLNSRNENIGSELCVPCTTALDGTKPEGCGVLSGNGVMYRGNPGMAIPDDVYKMHIALCNPPKCDYLKTESMFDVVLDWGWTLTMGGLWAISMFVSNVLYRVMYKPVDQNSQSGAKLVEQASGLSQQAAKLAQDHLPSKEELMELIDKRVEEALAKHGTTPDQVRDQVTAIAGKYTPGAGSTAREQDA